MTKTTPPGWFPRHLTPRERRKSWRERPISDLGLGPKTTELLAERGWATLELLRAALLDPSTDLKGCRMGDVTKTKCLEAIARFAWDDDEAK